MTEDDVPSVVGVLGVVALVNLLLPAVATLLGEEMRSGGHAARALGAAALVLTGLVVWFRFPERRSLRVEIGLLVMVVVGLASLLSTPWGELRPASIVAALPLFLIPALAGFLGSRKH